MKVLQVNKFLKIVGGSETYMFTLSNLLEKHGVEVAFWGMADEENRVGNKYGPLAENIDFKEKASFFKKLGSAAQVVYSKTNKQRLAQVLDAFNPDIVHIHNYNFQLTTSILDEIKKRNIKVVHTIHDSQLVCPAHRLYIEHKNEVCTKCLYGKFYNAMSNKCFENSTAKSFLGAAESYFAHNIKDIYNTSIDAFISPSNFFKNKIQPVIDKEIIVLPNCVESKDFKVDVAKEDFVLFFGRLSVEKGMHRLYEFFKQLDVKLVVVGKGDLKPPKHENIEYLGPKYGDDLFELVAKAKYTIHPSYWYENCPMSVIESFMLGTPVIVAKTGGLPEMVNEEVGHIIDFYTENTLYNLKEILDKPYGFKSQIVKQYYIDNYGEEKHLEKVMGLYHQILSE